MENVPFIDDLPFEHKNGYRKWPIERVIKPTERVIKLAP